MLKFFTATTDVQIIIVHQSSDSYKKTSMVEKNSSLAFQDFPSIRSNVIIEAHFLYNE